MKIKIYKTFFLAIILLCFCIVPQTTSSTSYNQILEKNNNYDTYEAGFDINRTYCLAQIYGEINITDTIEFTDRILPDFYTDIRINGTVTNSSLPNLFSIWPPLSLFPFLRSIYLLNEMPIYIEISYFRGSLSTLNNGTSYKLYGFGLFFNVRTTI